MSRMLQTAAPALKVVLVVVIIAAWVEANAKRLPAESTPPPAHSLGKAAPPRSFDPLHRVETPSTGAEQNAGECSPKLDRRNAQRIVPARAPVIRT